MWKKASNSNSVKPESIDKDSSNSVVFVRKKFELISASEEIPEHWEYLEMEIPKNSFDIFEELQKTTEYVAELEDVICELTS